MITLPLATGMDSTNEATNQPMAGQSAPAIERIAHAPSRQVASSTTQNTIAPSGAFRLYWKLPIRPSTTPARNRTAYAPAVSSTRVPFPPVAMFTGPDYWAVYKFRIIQNRFGPPPTAPAPTHAAARSHGPC